jgi:hypothetical protein
MDGNEMLGLTCVLLDFLTQSRDVIVYGSRQRKIVVPPNFIEQLIARNSLPTMLDEVLEHPEFAR